MSHQYENILNLLYGLKDQDDLTHLFEQSKGSPTHQGIWNDYQDLKKTIAEHMKAVEKETSEESSAPLDLISTLLKEAKDET